MRECVLYDGGNPIGDGNPGKIYASLERPNAGRGYAASDRNRAEIVLGKSAPADIAVYGDHHVGQIEQLSPHTRSELDWWLALSLTAGFCEEFIFRGYLIWALQPMFGLWGAAALSIVLFAAGYAYQGAKGFVLTGVVGGAFTLVVLVFGSLLPAMVLHALVDIGQGVLAWVVLGAAKNEVEEVNKH